MLLQTDTKTRHKNPGHKNLVGKLELEILEANLMYIGREPDKLSIRANFHLLAFSTTSYDICIPCTTQLLDLTPYF